jgi:hypothetical protein
MHPWIYGYRQYLPPDDLPDDFSEADWGDEDEELWLIRVCRIT